MAILGAFALALGLILDPAFRIEDAEADLHDEAQLIFDAALADRLDWKLLYAFLSSNRFTRGAIQSPEGEVALRAAHLPPDNRNFYFRVRPFSRLIAPQRASDAATTTKRREYDIQTDIINANVALDPGVAHSNDFPSDSWTEEFCEGIAREVVHRRNWTLSSTEDDVKSEYRGLSKSPEGSQTQSNDLELVDQTAVPAEPAYVFESGPSGSGQEPVTEPTQSGNNQAQPEATTIPTAETDVIAVLGDEIQPTTVQFPIFEPATSLSDHDELDHGETQPTAAHTSTEIGSALQKNGSTPPDTSHTPLGPHIDHDPLPEDFEACAHLQKRLEELDGNSNNEDEPSVGNIDHATSLDSIASVLQAIQELFPPGRSITLTS